MSRPDEPANVRSQPARKRRPLRVPLADVECASAADESLRPISNGSGSDEELSNVVSFDAHGANAPRIEPGDDRDPTEPTFMTMPDPLADEQVDADDADLSDPGIDVHFSLPPSEPPPSTPPPESAAEARFSEPPEELFLEDAEVLSRSDIAPPAEAGTEMVIPIPKPPPPPADAAEESKMPEVEADDHGPWYEHFFGEAYLRTVRATTPKEVALECDFIERAMRVPVGARMLDVGCGLGAQTVELAARGYHMVGLDISPTMVSRARDEAEDRGLQIDFVQGDVRAASFDDPYDALLCWGTTFGYFTEEENEQTVRQFHRAIKPGGILLLDVINRDFMIGSQPNQVWFEVDGAVCMEETDFDYEASRLRVKRRVASHSGQQNDRYYSIRLYALHEIAALLERNGFRVDEISGREATLGVFFGVHSPKMIIRAERRPGPFSEESAAPSVPAPNVPKGALRPSELPLAQPREDADEP